MKDLFNEMGQFSIEVFSEAKSIHHIMKLKHEADEVLENPNDINEYVDCLLALYAAMYKSGFIYEDILSSARDKFEVLKSRDWVVTDGIYQHIRK